MLASEGYRVVGSDKDKQEVPAGKTEWYKPKIVDDSASDIPDKDSR
jgi:hypothetical protein